MVTGQSPGKTQPRDDLESEDLPVQRSPLPPASDREEIHIRLYCRAIHMLLPLWAEVFFISLAGDTFGEEEKTKY